MDENSAELLLPREGGEGPSSQKNPIPASPGSSSVSSQERGETSEVLSTNAVGSSSEHQHFKEIAEGGGIGSIDGLARQPPQFSNYTPAPIRRFNSLAEAFGVKPEQLVQQQQQQQPKQPLQNASSAVNMSNAPPIPGSPLASPQSQQSLNQSFDGMAASPFPPHMHQYAAHASPVPMSPVHNSMQQQPQQSPGMSPSMAPGSVGGPGMYPQPPTPQRPNMPQGMPMTPGAGGGVGPPGTPGASGSMTPHPMTPTSQQQQQHMMMMQQQQQQAQMMQQQQIQQGQSPMMQQQPVMGGQPMQQMQPGMQPNPQMMVGMPPQAQMMMQGQPGQPYGYPQPGQAWMQQQQMMPPQYVRKPQVMTGGPPQRVMIQRVPYPTAPGYPAGTVPPQQQPVPAGAQYGRPMPPQYPTTPGGQPMVGGPPPPGYGYPAGAMPVQQQQLQQMPQQMPQTTQQQQQQMPPGYPTGAAAPPGCMQPGLQPVPPGMQPGPGTYVTPQFTQQQQQMQQRPPMQQQQQPQPGQMPMRPYMQSPQGQPMMPGQQPVFPQSVQPQPQQQPPGTPQTPFTTPNAARFPPGTPTSSPLHGTPQQLQQQQQGSTAGSNGPTPQQQQQLQQPPGTPQQQGLPPDMRSPQLMSPSQAQMMQQQQQTQPAMHPTARQMSNGDLQHMRPQQQPQPMGMPQQQQMVVAAVPPPSVQHSGGPYLAREPAVAAMLKPDMMLVGCHIVVMDWERYSTEKTDMMALRNLIRTMGGEIDFGQKAFEPMRSSVTHLIISHLSALPTMQRPPGLPPVDPLTLLMKENKRVVTMQWLVDIVEKQSMEVPWRIAHLPIPHQAPEQMRLNQGRIISVTGFTDSERGAVKYMVESIGAKLMPGVSQHTHLLVAKHPSTEKVEKAQEWLVPVVNLQWLVDAYLGQSRVNLEHPRYQISHQSPVEINCGPFTLELFHDQFKSCLAPWRYGIPCGQQEWDRAMLCKHHMSTDEHVYPLKKLKLTSPPAPSEEDIVEAHAASPPPESARQMVVAFEGFDDEFTDALKRKVRMLGGRVTDEVEACSHLVCIDGKRTLCLLKAILLGKNLVTAAWVNASYATKGFADTFDFFLRDDESERMHGCNFRLSVMRARRSGVFEDCDFYVSPSVEPSVEVVAEICRLGGGVVHPDPPSPAKLIECLETDKPYIIVSTECDMPILKYLTDAGVSVYNTELVFSACMRQEVDPLPVFTVNPNACQPAPLRLPSCGGGGAAPAAPAAAAASYSAASTPSRRTSLGQTPPPSGAAAAAAAPVPPSTPTPVDFASPQTPRIRAN